MEFIPYIYFVNRLKYGSRSSNMDRPIGNMEE